MFLKTVCKNKNESTSKLIPLVRKKTNRKGGEKKELQTNFLRGKSRCKIPQYNACKLNTRTKQKIICQLLGFTLGMKTGSVYTNQ